MNTDQVHAQGGQQESFFGLAQAVPAGGMYPLHRLHNICCSTGLCREASYWPMAVPQDGWLQLDQDPGAAVPLVLAAFSDRGVTVVLSADVGLQPNAPGQLLTQAHGAGLRHRPVRCCWHRPHPLTSEWQLAGLRFAGDEQL